MCSIITRSVIPRSQCHFDERHLVVLADWNFDQVYTVEGNRTVKVVSKDVDRAKIGQHLQNIFVSQFEREFDLIAELRP